MPTDTIEAPLPGVFYRRPDPDEDPYVDAGADVAEGDVVGLVGVMKSFHEVKAPADGTIVDVFAENEQEIEAGDPLFEIET